MHECQLVPSSSVAVAARAGASASRGAVVARLSPIREVAASRGSRAPTVVSFTSSTSARIPKAFGHEHGTIRSVPFIEEKAMEMEEMTKFLKEYKRDIARVSKLDSKDLTPADQQRHMKWMEHRANLRDLASIVKEIQMQDHRVGPGEANLIQLFDETLRKQLLLLQSSS